ncbi:MAG: hypothetical protein H6713_11730 [Myxococcales bacterium]|nr:hypothetical protein [Myxococcales bacterium]
MHVLASPLLLALVAQTPAGPAAEPVAASEPAVPVAPQAEPAPVAPVTPAVAPEPAASGAVPFEATDEPECFRCVDERPTGPWEGTDPDGRFAFAFLPGLTFGVSYLPSIDLPLYFGGVLPERKPGRRWTLGYQATISLGYAERYIYGLATHRHHITAMTVGERRPHLYGSIGGGVAFLLTAPVIEVEGRVGYVFGKPPLGRVLGVFGAMARLGWNVGYREGAPMPQFGLFIGVLTGPRSYG